MTASVSWPALVAHPGWSEVVVLAEGGSEGVHDLAIHGLSVVADVRADPPRSDRHLVVVATGSARTDWHLDVLLRRVKAAGAVAVMLPGTEPLQQASKSVADRMGLPVVGARDPMDAAVLVSRLVHDSEQVAAELVSRVTAACARAPIGLDPLIGLLSRAMDRDVWLLDGHAAVLAGQSPSPIPPGTAMSDFGLTSPDADGPVVLTRLVTTEHRRGAWVVAKAAPGIPADLMAVDSALQVAAAAIGQRLAEQRLTVERDARHRMSLLGELLQPGADIGVEASRRAMDAGWQLEGWHIGIRIDVPGHVDPVTFRPEVLHAFESAQLPVTVVEQGSGWAAWTTFDHEPTQADLQRNAVMTRRAQWLLRPGLPAAMGVGRAKQGAAGLAATLGEAGDAARLAATRSASGYLVHVDRLGLGQLLLAWTRTDTFAPAARSLLEPLDGQPGDLLVTLTAYLDAESSLIETAGVLGVHRNTVSARIAKVATLLGINLHDPDERLALHLACRSVLFNQ